MIRIVSVSAFSCEFSERLEIRSSDDWEPNLTLGVLEWKLERGEIDEAFGAQEKVFDELTELLNSFDEPPYFLSAYLENCLNYFTDRKGASLEVRPDR